MIYNGIEYSDPEVFLINQPGLGSAEIAGRICYDSFDQSEHECIRNIPLALEDAEELKGLLPDVYDLKNSDLLLS